MRLTEAKPILTLAFLLLLNLAASAQFLPRFTQYREYAGLINPAALPADFLPNNGYYPLSVGISHRSEGFSGRGEAPQTQALRVSWTPASEGRFRLLAGGHILKDRFGPTAFTGAFFRVGTFTYGSPEFGILSAGFQFGITQFRLDAGDTHLLAPDDPLQHQVFQKTFANLGAGIYYSRRFGGRHDGFAGVSVPQLFDLNRAPGAGDPAEDFSYRSSLNPHYYGLLGATLYVSDYAFWEPSVWLKILPGERVQADINLRYQFRGTFWAGAGASTEKTVHTEFGIHIRDMIQREGRLVKSRKTFMKLGFGYDFSFSPLPAYLDQAVELNLALLFAGN